MNELLSIGYAAIDKIGGEKYLGGAAAGIAINGKRLGLDTGLLALFGKDSISLHYMDYLVKLGVNIAYSQTFPNVSMPTNEVSLNNQTANHWKDNGINMVSPNALIREEDLNPYGIVHLASPPFPLAEKVAQKRNGLLTYSPGPKLLNSPELLSVNALRRSNILFLNEGEWHAVKTILNVDKPGDIIDYGPQIVVTTLGSRGATVSYRTDEDIEEFVPSINKEITETTGAGDAFSLGFVIGYLHNLPSRVCAEIGTIMSSYAINRNGVVISDEDILSASHKIKNLGAHL